MAHCFDEIPLLKKIKDVGTSNNDSNDESMIKEYKTSVIIVMRRL